MGLKIGPKKWVTAAYLLPSLILFTFVVFFPIVIALKNSMYDWPGGSKMTYIGLGNYAEMMKDKAFWTSFANNMYLTVFCVVGQIGLAFVFATLLSSKLVKFKNFHRTISYLPVTLSAVVVGFVWTMIYDYNYGLLNYFLRAVGLSDMVKPWLSDSGIVMTLVSIPLVWQYIGMYLIIILAASTSIDRSIFEVAEIDGAKGFQKAVYITFPLIKNSLIICVMLCISGNMKAFDHIYAMTGGGPGYASSVMSLYSYNISFMSVRMGYGSALSVSILVISLVIVVGSRVLLQRMTRKGDV